MIIEYAGEVVRPCLTDKRERENEGKVRKLRILITKHHGEF
jgi:hypothetical protein